MSVTRSICCFAALIAAFSRGVCAVAVLSDGDREQLSFVCDVMRFDKTNLSQASVEAALDEVFPSGADLPEQFQVFFRRMDRSRIPPRASVRVDAYPEMTVVSFEIEKPWGVNAVHYEIRTDERGIAFRGLSLAAIVEGNRAEEKAAQPGATDNPDDAQRLREEH